MRFVYYRDGTAAFANVSVVRDVLDSETFGLRWYDVEGDMVVNDVLREVDW